MFQRILWEHGRDAFLSAMVVTREFGLIGELFHMVFQSAIS